MLDPIIAALAPFITEALVAILTVIFATVAAAVRKYLGTQAEKIMRDALHQAIETGIKQKPIVAGLEAAAAHAAVDYAHRSVPDAIKGLSATQDVLVNIALSKMSDLRKRGF